MSQKNKSRGIALHAHSAMTPAGDPKQGFVYQLTVILIKMFILYLLTVIISFDPGNIISIKGDIQF